MIKHQFIFDETGIDSQATQAQVAEIVVPATEVTLPATITQDITVAINDVKDNAVQAINTAADRLVTSQATVTINSDYPANIQCMLSYTADYDCIVTEIHIVSGIETIDVIKLNNIDKILPITLGRNQTLYIYATTNDLVQSLTITYTLLASNRQLIIYRSQYPINYRRTTPCFGGFSTGNLVLFCSGQISTNSIFLFDSKNKIYDFLATYTSIYYNYDYIADIDCLYVLATNHSSVRPYYIQSKQFGTIVNLNYATYNQLYIQSRRSVLFYVQRGFVEVSIDNNTIIRTVLIDNVSGAGYMQVIADRYLYLINTNSLNSRILCYDMLNNLVISDNALPCASTYYPRICIYEPTSQKLFIGYGGQPQPIRVIDANPQSPTFNQLIASVGNYLIEWAMALVNGYIYFCDNNQGKIYKLNPSNYTIEQLAASIMPGTNYAFSDSYNVYFININGWIYTLPL